MLLAANTAYSCNTFLISLATKKDYTETLRTTELWTFLLLFAKKLHPINENLFVGIVYDQRWWWWPKFLDVGYKKGCPNNKKTWLSNKKEKKVFFCYCCQMVLWRCAMGNVFFLWWLETFLAGLLFALKLLKIGYIS